MFSEQYLLIILFVSLVGVCELSNVDVALLIKVASFRPAACDLKTLSIDLFRTE